jgi:hypothetical protein
MDLKYKKTNYYVNNRITINKNNISFYYYFIFGLPTGFQKKIKIGICFHWSELLRQITNESIGIKIKSYGFKV